MDGTGQGKSRRAQWRTLLRGAGAVGATCVAMFAFTPPARAAQSTVYHWDIFEYYTNYAYWTASGGFLINYWWTSDNAHSSRVRSLLGSNLQVLGSADFPAHSLAARYIDQSSGLLYGTPFFLSGRSLYGAQYNRNGVTQH